MSYYQWLKTNRSHADYGGMTEDDEKRICWYDSLIGRPLPSLDNWDPPILSQDAGKDGNVGSKIVGDAPSSGRLNLISQRASEALEDIWTQHALLYPVTLEGMPDVPFYMVVVKTSLPFEALDRKCSTGKPVKYGPRANKGYFSPVETWVFDEKIVADNDLFSIPDGAPNYFVSERFKQGGTRTPTICKQFPTVHRGNLTIARLLARLHHGGMTYPRSQLISDEEPGFFHCVSRCVRRAFLCGFDGHSGKSFEHRRQWIEDRIFKLAESFAVSVYAYAVMSNHFHVILRTDPHAPWEWSDLEVAERWLAIFPGSISDRDDPACVERATLALLGNAERLAVIRQRLGSISWFMRALNEPIARMANREDGCTGRFWEGRFKCQALLDEQAVLSCMAYVDLNPVRAGMCEALRESAHTSVRCRLESARSAIGRALGQGSQDRALKPVAGLDVDALSDLTESSYIELVRWTGLQAHPGKRGRLSVPTQTPPEGLWQVASHPREWIRRVQGTENRYYRAIGSAEALMLKAADLGQRWMKGVSGEIALKKLREQPLPW